MEGSVATVTLSNSGKFNAMSRSMWRALRSVFEALHHDIRARCIVLRGEGGHFCAGGDIAEYADFRFAEASLRAFHEADVWGGLKAILDCDVPVVAQIEGNCLGAGMEIASCCDIRIAGDSARFGAPIARLGFPMAPREAALVARAAGDLTAREMLLEAALLPASVMLQRGFLNRLAGDTGGKSVAAECQATALRIASMAPQAARMNKQVLRALRDDGSGSVEPLLEKAYSYADSAEHREGIASFTEKRKPRF
ncbi:MAG: enoyl-CoA hydratase/isomerase family protein [Comamonadaceae bacterium]|nr:MAG: enoyl-CoA hydratase/isomerase family protein [Comamonadaceae bacterium]